jgi:hypothetical protein
LAPVRASVVVVEQATPCPETLIIVIYDNFIHFTRR